MAIYYPKQMNLLPDRRRGSRLIWLVGIFFLVVSIVLGASVLWLVLSSVRNDAATNSNNDSSQSSSLPVINNGNDTQFPSPDNIKTDELLAITNEYRIKIGLKPLAFNVKLAQSAKLKCDDLVGRNYWSHNTPENIKPWTFIETTGYTYLKVGENLAYGFATSADVIQGWKESPEHNQNLINPEFQEVGFAVCASPNFVGDGPQTIIVQHLGKPRS